MPTLSQPISIAQILAHIISQLETLSQCRTKSKVINLTKLNPNDYHLWAVQAESTFMVHKAWQIVQGLEVHPAPGITTSDDGTGDIVNGDGSIVNAALKKKVTSFNFQLTPRDRASSSTQQSRQANAHQGHPFQVGP
jgi:hypothetical protein